LKQSQYQPMPAENEIAILFAGANGYLDEWPAESVGAYEKQMLEFMGSKYQDLLNDIKETNDISDELAGKLKAALDEFKGIFQPAT
ncbi:MAG: F0F1 ATP synthase subunit alpha, partial [Deltaproteobacteria bacterium]